MHTCGRGERSNKRMRKFFGKKVGPERERKDKEAKKKKSKK